MGALIEQDQGSRRQSTAGKPETAQVSNRKVGDLTN